MRVKFLQAVAGPHWCYLPREIVELPDAVARGYVASGAAEPFIEETGQEEAAALASGLTAVMPGHPPRRRGAV